METKNEIEVLENIIRILNRCLVISVKNARLVEVKSTLQNINTCKKELKKIREKQALGDSTKEK
jgi:hypothetical protein